MSDIKEVETVDGFDIPKRELTEEEANRDITFERFEEWHNEVGEDFCDQVGHLFNEKIFGGWLLHKYPEKSKHILELLNNKFCDVLSLQEIFEDNSAEGNGGDKTFYTDFAQFLNQTEKAKKRVNQILIQVMEYHNS